jgi:AcrR family transcriptional regulator
MSGNSVRPTGKLDRRVIRTRNLLGDALVRLMQEKPWQEITVQQVLDRAEISRSTFYKHYSDKNDLFMSDVEDFFAMMSRSSMKGEGTSRRILPVREFCAHLVQVEAFVRALHDAGKMQDVWELGRGHFARAVEKRLSAMGAADPAQEREAESRAYMLAGALISLLAWWMDRGMTETPEEVDRMFHDMVWAGANPLPGDNRADPAKRSGQNRKRI